MYLTKMKIKVEEAAKFKNDYETHRTVCKVLRDPKEQHLFLKRSGDVLILSNNKPEGEDLEIKEIPDDYVSEGEYRFRVKVNAVVTKNKKRIPLVGDKQVREWFLKRAASWGVEVLSMDVLNTEKSISYKEGSCVTVCGSDVVGILKVVDADILRKVFENGIGKARRLGYGMIQLIKA